MFSEVDLKWMNRCLDLAESRIGATYPNPLVGSVIAEGDRWIAEGVHKRAGEPHAERMALDHVRPGTDLSRATLYVNLEPCSHHGKTPPCAHAIAKSSIRRVVVAHKDPNPLVAGQGIAYLRENGIDVVVGPEEKAARLLNRRFLTSMEHQRPYIILKWAESADGYVDLHRNNPSSPPAQISGPLAQLHNHRWRSQEQALLIGYRTALLDNPQLNVRYWKGRSPQIVVWDNRGQLPASLQIFQHPGSLRFTKETIEGQPGKSVGDKLTQALHYAGIQSIYVEGGPTTHQLFIDSGRWDEIRVFQSKSVHLNSGVPSAVHQGRLIEELDLDTDLLRIYKRL